jgi:hypothetical protein
LELARGEFRLRNRIENLSANVALLNADQTFNGSNVFNQRVTVNGAVESRSGGVKFPDGSVQVKAATNTAIIAAVEMQFSIDDRAGWTSEAVG